VRAGERVTVRAGARNTREGDRVTVRDGDRVTVRDGERVTVGDGERVVVRVALVRPEDLDTPRWPRTTSDARRRVTGMAIQDVVLIIGAAPSEAIRTVSAIAIPPYSTPNSFHDKALCAPSVGGSAAPHGAMSPSEHTLRRRRRAWRAPRHRSAGQTLGEPWWYSFRHWHGDVGPGSPDNGGLVGYFLRFWFRLDAPPAPANGDE